MIRLLPLVSLFACGSDPEPTTCHEGFALDDDGLCYEIPEAEDTDVPEPVPPTMEDLLATLPACEAEPTGDRLDLEAFCADGLCAGDSAEEALAAAGDPRSCDGWAGYFVDCDWGAGLTGTFLDDDGDGEADPDEILVGVAVDVPWTGTDAGGLGLGATMTCFVEALGLPDTLTFTQLDGEWNAVDLEYGDLYVQDTIVNKTGDYEPDGRADRVTMYSF